MTTLSAFSVWTIKSVCYKKTTNENKDQNEKKKPSKKGMHSWKLLREIYPRHASFGYEAMRIQQSCYHIYIRIILYVMNENIPLQNIQGSTKYF